MPHTSLAQGLNPAAAWPLHPSEDHIPEGSKLGSRSPCLRDSLCPEHSGRDQGVLRLTVHDNGADMMVMAESQGLATVSLCLLLHGPRDHWKSVLVPPDQCGGRQKMMWGHLSVLVAPRPMWREAESGMGTSVTFMLTTATTPNQSRPTPTQCGDNYVPSVHRSPPLRCCSTWMRGRTQW